LETSHRCKFDYFRAKTDSAAQNPLQGNRLGDARGITVDSILLFHEVKASNLQKVSLMHYLAAYIARKRPEAAAFVHELDFARSLSQVPIDLLFNEANVLRSWYSQVFKSVQETSESAAAAASNPSSAAIWHDPSLPPFFSRAFAALASADAALAELEARIVAVKALLLQFCK
jgi:hypothetical protein